MKVTVNERQGRERKAKGETEERREMKGEKGGRKGKKGGAR